VITQKSAVQSYFAAEVSNHNFWMCFSIRLLRIVREEGWSNAWYS